MDDPKKRWDSNARALMHYGTPRHSGRYPWGSGDNPYQRSADFLSRVQTLKKSGMSEPEIAEYLGFGKNGSKRLRERKTVAAHEIKAYNQALARKLRDKGLSKSQIARRMNVSFSTVTSFLNESSHHNTEKTESVAKLLRDDIDRYKYIDVGGGVNYQLGITQNRLTTAVEMLKREGYVEHTVRINEGKAGKSRTMKVLTKGDVSWKEVNSNKGDVHIPNEDGRVFSEDGGQSLKPVESPRSVDSKRVLVRYSEEGGKDKDGLVELRRGVDDISLNNAKYAQVRIAVDGTHYIKGMAMYGDSSKWPDGVDIVFNTSKTKAECGGDMKNALKEMKKDPDNPFGASIKMFDDGEEGPGRLIRAQRHYVDANGKVQQSALNIVSEEGDWTKWKQRLSSQFLSKQAPELAKRQLNMKLDIAKDQFDEIMSYSNPTIRASMLMDFARQCDSDAADLYAAALPRQSSKVILPIPSLPEGQIYAPGYHDGETVALVRFPHAGPFESPLLKVNNKHREAKKLIGESIDAVGINHKAAEQLSGADFDGDTVLVLPVAQSKIKTDKVLKGLAGFDPGALYPKYEGMHVMTDREKGIEMGKVSNLITDMTIKGAPVEDIVRAVRHSMVVIDAPKHKYNWKLSEEMEGIRALKAKWQGGPDAGASTIISRADAEEHINERREKALYKIEKNPDELAAYKRGELIFENTGRMFKKWHPPEEAQPAYVDETGKKHRAKEAKEGYTTVEKAMQTVSKMDLHRDAFELVSGSPDNTTRIEAIYAEYANAMKAMANEARKQARASEDIPYSPSAAKAFKAEVDSLKAKVRLAESNQPLERKAHAIAASIMSSLIYNDPSLKQDKDKLKKLRAKELDIARRRVGAKKYVIGDKKNNPLTPREWEAINSGAVSKTLVLKVLKNADKQVIKNYALPRTSKGLSVAKINHAKTMLKRGYSQDEVAEMLDCSVSTLVKAIGVSNFDV